MAVVIFPVRAADCADRRRRRVGARAAIARLRGWFADRPARLAVRHAGGRDGTAEALREEHRRNVYRLPWLFGPSI